MTVSYDGVSETGRLLVYCHLCREHFKKLLLVNVPLNEVNSEVWLNLYASGRTQSDPTTACEIVFGKVIHNIVKQAEDILCQSDEEKADG